MKKEKLVHEAKAPLKPVPDRQKQLTSRRRSFRTELIVPVVIRWVDVEGFPHEESTETKVVNAHGCLVLLRSVLPEGQKVELVNGETQEAHNGRVVWCGTVEPDGRSHVGIELENPNPRSWGEQYVDFLLWVAMQPRD